MTLITASRFDSMEEPEASAAQVRICAGGGRQYVWAGGATAMDSEFRRYVLKRLSSDDEP